MYIHIYIHSMGSRECIHAQVSSVDHTAPTVMCVLGLGDAIARQYGLAMAAQQVLPLLCPLLVQPTLSGPQFSQAMT